MNRLTQVQMTRDRTPWLNEIDSKTRVIPFVVIVRLQWLKTVFIACDKIQWYLLFI